MCHDGNSASLSVRYLNAQLSALYENAVECMRFASNATTDVKSAQYDKSKYTRALAQFHYFGRKAPKTVQSQADLHFYATFAKPEIKFVCNHDAVLFLTIQDGHANLEYNKVITSGGGIRADVRKNRNLHNVKVAFRLEFDRSNLKGRDSRIGNADSKHLIQMMILKFETAKLVKIESAKEINAETKDALKVYLGKYLDFLRHAGNHVLFDLPDFDDDKFKPKIDYSQHKETIDLDVFCGGIQIQSINLDDINEQLSKKWATAKRLALNGTDDSLSTCVAEISSQWLMNSIIDDHFYIQFRTPRVKALCSQEVILYFDISNIWFFDGEDFSVAKHDYFENWTVAFIVDVVEYKEGSVTEIRLNFDTARISRIHSKWLESASKFFNTIVKFLSVDYLDILVQYSMHIVYHVDVLATGLIGISGHAVDGASDSGSASWSSDSEGEDGGEGRGVRVGGEIEVRVRGQIAIYASMIMKMSLFGFDQITALSEEAMNAMFASYYREARVKGHVDYARIYNWTKSSLFTARFNGISVHLLSGNKAVVCITVDSGNIALKKKTRNDTPWTKVKNYFWPSETDEVEKYEFNELVLAYEVDIKMVDDAALSRTDFVTHFHASDIYQSFRDRTQWYHFKHIILDVRNARFVEELSNISSLGKDVEGVIRLELVQGYIHQYLEQLADGGYHVVQSLPFLTRPDAAADSYAFTDIACQVVAKGTVTIKNCTYKRSAAEAPALLVYGMCGGRPMPSALIQWLTGWIIPGGKRKTFGTVCLNKHVFLEGRLLRLLEAVNRRTTLVPKFAGVIDGEWHYDLSVWDADAYRKNKQCNWKPRHSGATDCLEYVWEHRDEWSHEHEGTSTDEKNGEYSLACRTKNKLVIPTAFRSSELKIVLSGESSIRIKGKADHQSWSKKTTASWESQIVVYSKPYGLVVNVVSSQGLKFAESEVEGACAVDVLALHRKYLAQIDLADIEASLRGLLSGAWEYAASTRHRYALSQPVFTREGDLIVQLVELKKGAGLSYAQVAASSSAATPRVSVQTATSTVTSVISGARSILMQSAKLDLPATFGYANGGLASSVSTLSSVSDSPPLKTPALSPSAPAFNPSTKSAPGFNASLKTASLAQESVLDEI